MVESVFVNNKIYLNYRKIQMKIRLKMKMFEKGFH